MAVSIPVEMTDEAFKLASPGPARIVPAAFVERTVTVSSTAMNMSRFLSSSGSTAIFDDLKNAKDSSDLSDFRHFILLMYLLHALPYTQSAFNWLFYAFLNKNLRQSSRYVFILHII